MGLYLVQVRMCVFLFFFFIFFLYSKSKCDMEKSESFVPVITVSNRELHLLICPSQGDMPQELMMAEVSCHFLQQAAAGGELGLGDLLEYETFHALAFRNGKKM